MRLVFAATAAALLLAACSPRTGTPDGETPLPLDESKPAAMEAEPEAVLDPGALDLSKIALAMRIPSTFRAYEEGAYLQINVINPRLGIDIAENFALVQTPETSSAVLASEAKDGFTVWTYGTKAEDTARLAELSAELARLKREAPGENELAFGAVAPGCWNEPEQTPGSLARTLYIRLSPEEDFIVLVPEQVVSQGAVPGTESFWGACKD
jgi:hypothetical protein